MMSNNKTRESKAIQFVKTSNFVGEIYRYDKKKKIYILKGNYIGEMPAYIYFLAANSSNSLFGTSAKNYEFPFPNETIAFENTKNVDSVDLNSNIRHFEFIFSEPNGFFSQNASIYHPPQIYVKVMPYKVKDERVVLNLNQKQNETSVIPIMT